MPTFETSALKALIFDAFAENAPTLFAITANCDA